jgi:hypothetical protein
MGIKSLAKRIAESIGYLAITHQTVCILTSLIDKTDYIETLKDPTILENASAFTIAYMLYRGIDSGIESWKKKRLDARLQDFFYTNNSTP